MNIHSFDHIVLAVHDVNTTRNFYETVLGMRSAEERPGKWSLHFGSSKISLQDATKVPDIAKNTKRGTANFCLLTQTPLADVVTQLNANNIDIIEGPAEKIGAMGPIYSVYFHDPDGNLVEVCNQL